MKPAPSIVLPLAAALLLAGCGGKADKEDAERNTVHVAPTVAPPVAPATEDPAATLHVRTFEGSDSDGDGYVSAAENAAAAATLFHAIDSDGDGVITAAELDAARKAMHLSLLPTSPELIARGDQDGDGRLTLAEWIAMRNSDFTAADTDADGRLTRAEWQKMFRLETASQPAPAASSSAP